MRVPLVLQLLAQPATLPALASPELQAVLDAALFEPGEWLPATGAPPLAEAPAADRAALGTPCGLLLNELVHAPAATLRPLESMLELAQERDIGRSPAGLRLLRT